MLVMLVKMITTCIKAFIYICFWSINILLLYNKSCDNLRFWKLRNKTHVAAVCHGSASISTVLCGVCVLSKYIYGGKHVLVQHTGDTVQLVKHVS